MHYLLTEKEMGKLASVKSQLNLVATLIAEMRPENTDTMCAPADLYEFLDAQRGCLEELESSANARHQATREDMQMTWVDWMHALRIANGRVSHTPSGAEQKIDLALQHMAISNPDFAPVFSEWARVRESSPGPQVESENPVINGPLLGAVIHAASGAAMPEDDLNEVMDEFRELMDDGDRGRSFVLTELYAALSRHGYKLVTISGGGELTSQWRRLQQTEVQGRKKKHKSKTSTK